MSSVFFAIDSRRASAARAERPNQSALELPFYTGDISRGSELIPSPRHQHVRHIRRSLIPNTAGTLVGVPARLGSHLREMTGLTIRATVSQLDCSAPSADVFTLSRLFTYCPASAVQSRQSAREPQYRSGIRRRFASTPKQPQPLHNRPPSPTGFNLGHFLVTPW